MGDGGARAPRARWRRVRPRRRAAARAASPTSCCSRLPRRARLLARRRLPVDARQGARATWATAPRYMEPTSRSWRSTSPSTSSSRRRRSTGSPTTRSSSRRSRGVLMPGGRLHAQCGGAGNVARLAGRSARSLEPPIRLALRRDERDVELRRAPRTPRSVSTPRGSAPTRAWLEPKPLAPPEPREFMRTVTLGPHLAHLPPESCTTAFVDAVVAGMRCRTADARLRPAQHRGGSPAGEPA